jgi:hypothetical protein
VSINEVLLCRRSWWYDSLNSLWGCATLGVYADAVALADSVRYIGGNTLSSFILSHRQTRSTLLRSNIWNPLVLLPLLVIFPW